ncbi:MAG: hypothetical protein QM778_34115 [Myxococcales bacterium]
MFGLIVGTLCLMGLFATLRRRHYYRFADYYGYHWGHHHGRGHCHERGRHHGHRGPWGHHHHEESWEDAPRMRGFGRRRPNPLHFLFAELDTTHGQEKAIMTALDALRGAKGALREEVLSARKELAQLFGAESLDAQALEALLGRQQEHLAKSGQLLKDFVALLHETLTPVQRKKLAAFLLDGSLLYGFDHERHHAF